MDNKRLRNIKPFDELTITDDFMFGAVMSEPKYLKPLLEFILNVKISDISYPEKQKTIDVNYSYKGIRLDVYCEDAEHTVYSVEIQTTDQKNLPKRIRYYRDMLDINAGGIDSDRQNAARTRRYKRSRKCFSIKA